METGENTTLCSWAITLREALEGYPVDSVRLFQQAGIDPQQLDDPLGRIPTANMTRLWDLATHETGDEYFGLRVAEHVTPTTFFSLGISAIAADNLLDALTSSVKSSTLIATAAEAKVVIEDGVWLLIIGARPGYPEFSPAAMDAVMGALVHLGRRYLGIEPFWDKVTLRHDAPSDPGVFETWFKSPVEFNAPCNAFHTARGDDLLRRFSTANSALRTVSEQIVADYLKKLGETSVSGKVKRELGERLIEGRATDQAGIARALGMSERKLQSSLKNEGTSFQQILDEVRQGKAIYLLTIEKKPVSEIALLLGFREISSFTRAFKRWTGKTPRDYLRTSSSGKTPD